MNHFIPIPFFIIAIIILFVGNKFKVKLLQLLAKTVITISVIVFIYQYTKYLGYDIFKILKANLF